MSDEKEAGWKWWLRFVIVPLIGSGGIIGLFLGLRQPAKAPSEPSAQMSRSASNQTEDIPQKNKPAESHRETKAHASEVKDEVEFFYFITDDDVAPRSKDAVAAGSTITVQWFVKGFDGVLTLVEKKGDVIESSNPVSNSGSWKFSLNPGIYKIYLFDKMEPDYGMNFGQFKDIVLTVQ